MKPKDLDRVAWALEQLGQVFQTIIKKSDEIIMKGDQQMADLGSEIEALARYAGLIACQESVKIGRDGWLNGFANDPYESWIVPSPYQVEEVEITEVPAQD